MRTSHSGTAFSLILIGLMLVTALHVHAQTGGQVFFQTTTFGMVGLARNQVARLNVLNPGNSYGNTTPVCSAEMEFLDDQGTKILLHVPLSL